MVMTPEQVKEIYLHYVRYQQTVLCGETPDPELMEKLAESIPFLLRHIVIAYGDKYYIGAGTNRKQVWMPEMEE